MNTQDPELVELAAELRRKRQAAERERQLSERRPLLAELRALEAEYGSSVPKERAMVARLERIAAEARAEWVERGNALQMLENRLSSRRQRLFADLAARPSEAQRVALDEMDAEIASARTLVVDPSIALDFDAWVRDLLGARDNIAAIAAMPDDEHRARIAAIRRAIPPRPEGVKLPPPRNRMAELAAIASEALAQTKAHGALMRGGMYSGAL